MTVRSALSKSKVEVFRSDDDGVALRITVPAKEFDHEIDRWRHFDDVTLVIMTPKNAITLGYRLIQYALSRPKNSKQVTP